MMETLTHSAMTLGLSDDVSVAVKAAVILIMGLVSAWLAGRAPASVRHLALAASFGAVLLLPFVSLATPRIAAITVDVAPAVDPVALAAAQPSAAPAGRLPESRPPTVPPPHRRASWSAHAVARAVWGIGALMGLALLAHALRRLAGLRRTSVPWLEGRHWMEALAAESGVTRHVDVLRHEEVAAPLAIGLWRPAILLPSDVGGWNDEDVRRALLHELEHVRRKDWAVQLAARVVCAAHWFNPLVWVAWRRLALEAERACDDAVVARAESTEYAEQLVLLAQRLAHAHPQPALAMARRSDLAVRVTAILDAAQRRGRAGMSSVLAVSLMALLSVAVIAPLQVVSAASALGDARSEGANASVAESSADSQSPQVIRTRVFRRPRAMDRALYEAADEGDLNQVTELIGAGANVNAAIEGDGSPLIGAARAGHADVVRVLLDNGAEPDLGVKGDGNALIMAAREGHSAVVALLLDRGASIDLIVPGDENALIQASGSGRLEVVQLLISRGADVNARAWAGRSNESSDGEWRTPLSMARRGRHAAVVSALIAAGARD